MSKVSIEQIEATLRDQKLDGKLIAKIVTELEAVAAEEKATKETGVKAKHDFAVLVQDTHGWVFQVEAGSNVATLPDRVKVAATEFNNSKKGRKVPVSTVGETIENVPTKFWKTRAGETTRVKSKTPVFLVATDGKI